MLPEWRLIIMANLFSILFIILVAVVGGIPTIVITRLYSGHDRAEDLPESEIRIFFYIDKSRDLTTTGVIALLTALK